MRFLLLALLLAPPRLLAQESPRPNRVAWLEIFPEPLPQGVPEIALEVSSQFLRPDLENSGDGRTFARLDGEEWQLTLDLPWKLGPAILNLRVRAAQRGGGLLDQTIVNWHNLLGTPTGGREAAPKGRVAYHLERDGVLVGDLDRARLSLMDTDLACLVPFGVPEGGGRVGVSLQLPTGSRKDFSGSGGWDAVAGGAGWWRRGAWGVHAQGERVFIGLPEGSPYRGVLGARSFSRAWLGLGYQGRGLGVDLTFGYSESPYRVGIRRIDGAGLQQHWTFSHRAWPNWRFGFSEEAGSYTSPDFSAFISWRYGKPRGV